MTPDQIALFRENSGKNPIVLRPRYCPTCKRHRSIAQFQAGDVRCFQCRLREAK